MPVLLSALPVLSVVSALLLGARSLHAALLGMAAAAIVIPLAFPIPAEAVAPMLLRWPPILAEVLLIVGGGLLLSETLRAAGAQEVLAKWIADRAGHGVGAVLLVVHGVIPFAESVTGFGVGVAIGAPLLINFGLPARKVAVLGLIGLSAGPWGSMGPGTLVAATMADLPLRDLGIASAVVSLAPFLLTGLMAAWMTSEPENRRSALMQGALSGILLTIFVTTANLAFGTPPAGALGCLALIALHLLRARSGGGALSWPQEPGRRALRCYALLLGGTLAAGAALKLGGFAEGWRYLASPALWLFVAIFWFARGAPEPEVRAKALKSWLQIAPVTGSFILLGVLMAVSGMGAFLAQAVAGIGPAYLAAGPFMGALGGFVTGSNSGANAMFASTQAEIARALNADLLWFMATHNVAAAFLSLASPGRVEMGIQLAGGDAAQHRRWIQGAVLKISFGVVCGLGAFNLLLA